MDDKELVQQTLQGQKHAFAVLVRKYQKTLYYYVASLGFKRAEAEELVQETFLKAYTHLSSFDFAHESKASFVTWLMTIARNLAFNELAKKKSFFRFLNYWSQRSTNEELETLNDLEMAEVSTQLQQALAKIPLEFRNPLILSYFKELKIEDIAVIEDCPVGTIKSRISRGKEKLKNILEKEYGYE